MYRTVRTVDLTSTAKSSPRLRAPIPKTDMPAKVFEGLQLDFLGPFGTSEAPEYRLRNALQSQYTFNRYLIFVPTIRNDGTTAVEAVEFYGWVSAFGFRH